MLDKLVVKLMVFKMRLSDERGQDVMEYAILTGGIAVALVVALVLFTDNIGGFFNASALHGSWPRPIVGYAFGGAGLPAPPSQHPAERRGGS